MDKKDKYSQFGPAVQCSNSIGSQQQWEFDEDSSCFSRNKFALSVMNFLGCIKETMDNSFFYGMMEENTSKKAVYTAGFLLAVPSQLSIPTICRSKRCRSWKSFWLRQQRKLQI